MSIWIILSWVAVAILTAINVGVFLKMKQASEQMMKMAFPNAKHMGDAMSQMQQMMGAFGGRPGMGGAAGNPFGAGGANRDAQLKSAMEMLKNLQQKGGPKGR